MRIWPFGKKSETSVELTPEATVEESTGRLTINAITYDESEERIRVDMDWDDEFVVYLKRHGFTGSTDEVIVHKYVATLYRNVLEDLGREGKAFE